MDHVDELLMLQSTFPLSKLGLFKTLLWPETPRKKVSNRAVPAPANESCTMSVNWVLLPVLKDGVEHCVQPELGVHCTEVMFEPQLPPFTTSCTEPAPWIQMLAT